MAIRIKQTATFMWPVEVLLPKSGGGFDKVTFDIEFRRLSTAGWREIMQEMIDGKKDYAGVAVEVVAGWGASVEDEPGVPVAFSDAALKELLNIIQVPAAIFNAYSKTMSGAAQEKN